MQLRKPATAILALALSAGLAQADDAAPAAGSTLDKIAKNGVIVVGHRESSVPFSYYDNQQKVVGYSQDYSNAIVEAVKKKLNKPDLQVKLIPITSQNRIPLLQNGTFDFECGSTTNNVERQKQAAFSDTIFVVGTRLLTKKGGDIKDFADLKGKAVVVTSGTTSEVLLNKLNEEQKMNMRIISAKDHGDSFRTLESGRAVAFMMDASPWLVCLFAAFSVLFAATWLEMKQYQGRELNRTLGHTARNVFIYAVLLSVVLLFGS